LLEGVVKLSGVIAYQIRRIVHALCHFTHLSRESALIITTPK
jgi:hypothetical protein